MSTHPMNYELIPLFSKPILKTEIQIDTVDLSSIKWAKNYQNWISESQDILNFEPLKQIRDEVQRVVSDYFYGIMRVSNDTEIYVTESWLNKTEKGQSHHRHWHPNSILSGVVVISSDPSSGSLRLNTSHYETIEYEIVESNLYNAKSWWFNTAPGDFILFPSSVEHLVEEYQGDIPRITLSFNTFVKGLISNSPLIKLKI
jgi:uncharacterized protein (TIGR02466 family)